MSKIKYLLFNLIINKKVNFLGRNLYRFLPISNKSRFPFVGKFTFEFIKGKKILLESDGTDSLSSRIYWKEDFENNLMLLSLLFLEENSIVFDIGANIGIYSLIWGSLLKKGKVYSFEPVPRILKFLNKNIENNDLEKRINVFDIVVSNKNDKVSFSVVESLTIPLGSSENPEFRKGIAPIKIIETESKTLDTFVEENKIDRISLIKIDVESTEHLVFQGMENVINNLRPTIICELLSDDVGKKIQEKLINKNYSYFSIMNKIKGIKRQDSIVFYEDSVNYLIIPNEKIYLIEKEIIKI